MLLTTFRFFPDTVYYLTLTLPIHCIIPSYLESKYYYHKISNLFSCCSNLKAGALGTAASVGEERAVKYIKDTFNEWMKNGTE